MSRPTRSRHRRAGPARPGRTGGLRARGPGGARHLGQRQRLASADACAKDQLQLTTAGKFTVGTDKPAYPPWFVDDDPTNGQGFESAVAYAVAEQLGFAKEEVTWVVVPFTNAYAPGPKNFDVDINQVSISEARRNAVDFSSGYYDVAQTVVTTNGSKIDGATTIAALKDAKLGAQVGTTSYTAITDQIQPDVEAGGLRHQRSRRAGAAERPGRRHRGRPAHRLLHHRGPARRRHDRRPAAGRLGYAGPVRHGAGQGQPADRLRQRCGGRAGGRRHAGASWRRNGWPGRTARPSCPDAVRRGRGEHDGGRLAAVGARTGADGLPPAAVHPVDGHRGGQLGRAGRAAGRRADRHARLAAGAGDVLRPGAGLGRAAGGGHRALAEHPGDARLRSADRRLRTGPGRAADAARTGVLPAPGVRRGRTRTCSAGCRCCW